MVLMELPLNTCVQADRTMRQSERLVLERLRIDSKFQLYHKLWQLLLTRSPRHIVLLRQMWPSKRISDAVGEDVVRNCEISNGPVIFWYVVEDLNLNQVKALQDSHVVAISKHLCGPATGEHLFQSSYYYIF